MAGGTSGTAVMASPRNILEKAFRQMAQGSQADAGTVTAVSTSLLLMHKKGMDNLAEHVAPRPRDLLQALGWLYPCCLPGSLLPPDVKQEALLAWGRCGALCFLLFVQTPVRSQAECVSLVAPRSQPPAPGVLQDTHWSISNDDVYSLKSSSWCTYRDTARCPCPAAAFTPTRVVPTAACSCKSAQPQYT
jgi:hypothetical protein